MKSRVNSAHKGLSNNSESEGINFVPENRTNKVKCVKWKKINSAHKITASLKMCKSGNYCFSSAEKMSSFIARMHCEPSGSVIFIWVRGDTTPLVKYLKAGLGDLMASRKTWRQKQTYHSIHKKNLLKKTQGS